MDLLQGVRDAREEKEATSNGPNSDGAPSLEKLLSALEKLNISDENKDQLRQKLNSKANIDKVKAVMEDGPPVVPYELLVLMLLISVVAAIFVFFGYTLYKSLIERERRKEEKKRQKQQKKKK